MDLALHEILVNIVHYAYGDRRGEIRLEVGFHPEDCTVEVRDWGVPFNPLEHPDHPGFKDLETAQVGGLGISMVRNLVDTASYDRPRESNRLTLVFRRG
jgi:anti-sigma regulatory factor (Ser/Thr protein kinase)